MDVSDFYNFSTFYVLSLHGIMEKDGKSILLSRHYSKPCLKLNLVKKSTNHYKLEICLPTGENSSSWKRAKNVSTLFIPIFYFVRCQRCLDLLRLFYSTCCIYKYRPEYYIVILLRGHYAVPSGHTRDAGCSELFIKNCTLEYIHFLGRKFTSGLILDLDHTTH